MTVALRPMRQMPGEVPVLVFIKLILHPLLVWVVLSAVGDFGPAWTYAAMIMAALPPALNIFVISTQYNVGVERASACILIGTLVSMFTLTGHSLSHHQDRRVALRSFSVRARSLRLRYRLSTVIHGPAIADGRHR